MTVGKGQNQNRRSAGEQRHAKNYRAPGNDRNVQKKVPIQLFVLYL